jgi:hypothetical protein
MFWSSTVSLPSTWAFGSTSCIRLIERRKVDLPQPDGPMRAVTVFGSTVRLMFSMALNEP